MIQQEENSIYNRNMKVLPFVFGLLTTPFYFFSTIYLYYVSNSFVVVAAVFSLGELTKAILEVPTGVISDKYLGRKGTQIAADLFQALGMFVQVLALYDWRLLFLGEFFIGIALSLYSGNTSSLLHDTLSSVGKEEDYHKEYGRMHHYRYMYWSFALLTAGMLAYYFGVVSVVYYCIAQRLIGICFSLFLKEPNFYNKKSSKSIKMAWLHILSSAKKTIKTPKLRTLVTLSVLRQSFASIDQLGATFYKSVMSFYSIAFLLSGSLFLCVFTSKYSEKIAKKFGFLRTFVGVRLIAVPLQMLGFAFPSFLSPILIELGASLNPIETSAQSALLHKQFTNKQRATMESVVELFGSIGYSISIVLMGFIAEVWSLSGALLLGTSLKFLVIPLCFKLFKK